MRDALRPWPPDPKYADARSAFHMSRKLSRRSTQWTIALLASDEFCKLVENKFGISPSFENKLLKAECEPEYLQAGPHNPEHWKKVLSDAKKLLTRISTLQPLAQGRVCSPCKCLTCRSPSLR